MRILVAVEKQPSDAYAVTQVAELAGNTWADITLLGMTAGPMPNGLKRNRVGPLEDFDLLMARALDDYRTRFIHTNRDSDTLYGLKKGAYRLKADERGGLTLDYNGARGRKNFTARVRFGNPVKEILAESVDGDSDLIILVCGSSDGKEWAGHAQVPQKVARNANCSVLIVKEEKKPEMIVCCLDQDRVTQASLEMINQLVTLYGVELEVVGLKTKDNLKTGVDRKMTQILDYYKERNIKAWVRLVDGPSLKSFISEAAVNNLVALWMGEESFLDKLVSKKLLENFVATAKSSVLILR